MYKTVIYENSVELEKGLNNMNTEGYIPEFVSLGYNGQTLVVYFKE